MDFIFVLIVVVWTLAIFSAVYKLAKKQIIFTFCKEGEIMFVTAGGAGNFHKLIYSIEGWVYDGNEHKFVSGQKPKSILEEWFGIHLIGIPFYHQIYEWEFTWNKWSKPDGETTFRIVPKTDKVKSLIFQFPYAISIPGVEIQGQIGVDFELLITLRSVKPYNALFLTGSKWLDTVVGTIEAATKEYIGQFEIDQVRKMERGKGDMDDFILRIKSLTDQLIKLAGQEVVDVQLLRYTQQGSVEMKEAAQAEEKAKLIGKGLVEAATQKALVAEQEAKAIETLAIANQSRLDKTIIHLAGGKGGPDAVEAFKWEQMKLGTYVEGGSKTGTNITTP